MKARPCAARSCARPTSEKYIPPLRAHDPRGCRYFPRPTPARRPPAPRDYRRSVEFLERMVFSCFFRGWLKSLAFRRSKIRRNVSQVNMSTLCGDKGNPVRHARGRGHPGWTVKELDSRFRGNDGRGHFSVGFKPTCFKSLGLQPKVV